MKKLAAILLLLAILLGGLAIYQHRTGPRPEAPTLTVYCAANLKAPVEEVADAFRAETGVEVRLQFGGTGTLLSNLRVAQQGDIFIAADQAGIDDARKYALLAEVLPLITQRPVVAVRSGNPLKIHAWADLLRPEVRVALANPEAAAIGRVVKSMLGTNYESLAKHAVVQKPTVSEIASDVSLGAADAAIVWDSTVPQFPQLTAVEMPEISSHSEPASAAVLAFTKQPALALRLARYLNAPEKGAAVFKAHGFTPTAGDKWAERPELILYSGGVNRPAIEDLLKKFADREGVTVTTIFNGCGILCATMKTMGDASNPQFPDAYFACDLCFVPPVAETFPEAVILTETEIGIVVRKGNPRGVKTLADLAQPSLKVGLCNAEQSTLGYMTRGLLKSSALDVSVQKNVVVETPTADLLVTQMRAGALDAAIVYRVNFQPSAEHLDYIAIQHEGAKAIQPFSVRPTSPNYRLGQRLLDFLKANRGAFVEAGFTWRGEEAALKSKDIVVPEWLKEK